MLRVYVAQQCFGLSDEIAIYGSQAPAGRVENRSRMKPPDTTTLLKSDDCSSETN